MRRRLIYFIVLLSIIIQFGLCSDTESFEEDNQFDTDSITNLTLTTEERIEPIVEDIADNITEPSVITTTTIFVKSFLTEVN